MNRRALCLLALVWPACCALADEAPESSIVIGGANEHLVAAADALRAGDAEEAINAANAIGDDTLTRGQVSSRNFTHGTYAQRMAALKKGMQTGDVGQCTLKDETATELAKMSGRVDGLRI